jgi:hypothetical protein
MIGGVAGAILAIIGVIKSVALPIKKLLNAQLEHQQETEKNEKAMDERFSRLERHQRETWLATLRHSIFSESLPLHERVNAGETYTSNGGNGTAKVQHEKNVEELRKELNGGG